MTDIEFIKEQITGYNFKIRLSEKLLDKAVELNLPNLARRYGELTTKYAAERSKYLLMLRDYMESKISS